MNITVIRHAKVKVTWPKKCDSREFDKHWAEYDVADIVPVKKLQKDLGEFRLYVSDLIRTHKTAQGLFPGMFFETLPVKEVPLRSFKDSDNHLPVWLWNTMGRIQWFLNNPRQEEIRKETVRRAVAVIKELQKRNEDCVIVTHGFFMLVFVRWLRKSGFKIHNRSTFGYSNLQMVTAVEK